MARTMMRKRSEAPTTASGDPAKDWLTESDLDALGGKKPEEAPLRRRSAASAPGQFAPPPLPEAWGGAKPAPTPKAPEPEFARANGSGLAPHAWEDVATMVHDVGDPAARLKELQRRLQVDAEQTWRANPVVRADLANQAKALHIAARLEAKKQKLDRQQIKAAMRKEAREALQEEADKGNRKGVISAAEIEAQVALAYPDQYNAAELGETRDEGMVEYLEQFASNLSATIRGGGT
jgi:hypothetical protein